MRLVVVIARRIEGADTGSVLAPLVLPERLVIALIILPVGVHVREQVRLAERVENGSYVGVFARWITVGIIRAVATVWPQAMNCPCINRAWGCKRMLKRADEARQIVTGAGGCVPELGEKQLSSGSIEAAQVGYGSCVVAAQLRIRATHWSGREGGSRARWCLRRGGDGAGSAGSVDNS